jgi:hypothetical protein
VRRFLGAFLRALAAWLATPFLLLAALALVIDYEIAAPRQAAVTRMKRLARAIRSAACALCGACRQYAELLERNRRLRRRPPFTPGNTA